MYNILEAKVVIHKNQLQTVTVLVHMSGNDFRVISSTQKPTSGYFFLLPDVPLTYELLQRVAAQGCETHDIDKQFKGWRRKYYNKVK